MDEMKLDQAATGTHDVGLKFTVTQDGAPFLESETQYHHCTDAVASFITGSLVSMSGALGPKGGKPKNGPFTVVMELTLDGQPAGAGTWSGLLREGVLMFEKQVLDIWGHMNQQAMISAKAQGKI